MSYSMQAQIADDKSLLRRVTACAAREQVDDDPYSWAFQHMWHLSATQGWVDAYSRSASDNPGSDEDAISDEMITDAVRAIISQGQGV